MSCSRTVGFPMNVKSQTIKEFIERITGDGSCLIKSQLEEFDLEFKSPCVMLRLTSRGVRFGCLISDTNLSVLWKTEEKVYIVFESSTAYEMLEAMAPSWISTALKEILDSGYGPMGEPFLEMMLRAIQVRKFAQLRVKAKLYVPDAALLIGCINEVGKLQYGQDVQDYFPHYMMNDSLGLILNAHLVFADRESEKAMSTKCMELAKLSSMAVDFAKTEDAAVIPPYLMVKSYPDFFEKRDKIMYKSEIILGKLYRGVSIPEDTISDFRLCYDVGMEVCGYKIYVDDANKLKNEYDRKLKRLLGQFGVKSESEFLEHRLVPFGVKEEVRGAAMQLRNEIST